jgi:hypothetical protein
MNELNELNSLNDVAERLHVDLSGSAARVNLYADKKDYSRNRVNYGYLSCCADTLRRLGYAVTLVTFKDEDGFFRNAQLIINGKEIAISKGRTV